MIKIILEYLVALANYNYEVAYWNAVKENKFSTFNIASILIEQKSKNRPKSGKPKINRELKKLIPIYIQANEF